MRAAGGKTLPAALRIWRPPRIEKMTESKIGQVALARHAPLIVV
jgi:hypothetical protein